jgi:hypothetical protein
MSPSGQKELLIGEAKMIIVSDFNDYYDSLAKQYRDPKIVYNRKQSQLFDDELKKETLLKNFINQRVSISQTFGYGKRESKEISVLGFCGYIFPFLFKFAEDYHKETITFDWDTPYQTVFKEDKGKRLPDWLFSNSNIDTAYTYDGKGIPDKSLKEWQTKNKIPVILCTGSRSSITINPTLKDVKFPLSCFEAFQRIAGFLSSDEPITVQTEDIYKVKAAGFDIVESFRREKGGPTRKRKKLSI